MPESPSKIIWHLSPLSEIRRTDCDHGTYWAIQCNHESLGFRELCRFWAQPFEAERLLNYLNNMEHHHGQREIQRDNETGDAESDPAPGKTIQ